jgi:hypothetical protein
MTFSLPLTQDDINFLTDTKENTQTQNELIQESSVTISAEVAKLLLIDTPFKKQLDPLHVDIFEFEEELRRLNGMSIIQPLQEAGFTVSNTSGNPARLFINNGRMIITENDIEIANLPLYPMRGFSRSQPAGTNFDIWSRDRFGSTTSSKHTSTIFLINEYNRNLRVFFDNSLTVEIDLSTLINITQVNEVVYAVTSGEETEASLMYFPITPGTETLTLTGETTYNLILGTDYTINYSTGEINFLVAIPADYEFSATYKNEIQLEAAALASSIQVLLRQADSSLQNVSCIFNESIKTFTIIGGHSGPTSSVEVVPASESDLMNLLGFSDQYLIQGKFQNNLLNIEIDGEAVEIKIADFRLCFEDAERGYNNDDIGFDWSGSLTTPLGYVGYDKLGPLFCSGVNNGKDVAKSIEAQLRIAGSDSLKNASVHYFSDDQTFVIYSGTMGLGSTVHVLPASDPDRDARALLGFDSPQEERGNETYFNTLQELFDRINLIPNMSAFDLTSPSRLSHSILYNQPTGVNIHVDFQNFDITTTKIYDDASRGLPRLYPNGKLVVDASNDRLSFMETTNVEKIAFIAHGIYDNEAFLAEAITTALNTAIGSNVYNCSYNVQAKLFLISRSTSFTLLLQTGENAISGIGNYLGFNVASDKSSINIAGTQYCISDFQVSFQMQDYFYPYFPTQFDGTGVILPLVPDYTIDELSALNKEEEYLNIEGTLTYDRLSVDTVFDNEVMITAWEFLATLELAKVNQQYNAIRYHRGAYANHISETDIVIVTKTTAYNNLLPNRTNLLDNLAYHARFLNITSNSDTFVAGTDFSNGTLDPLTIAISAGAYNKRIYNAPAPLITNMSSTRHIPGRFNPVGLMTTSAIYTPEPQHAFRIQNTNPGTQGYSYSAPDADGYNIQNSADTAATILSSNSGTYDMSAGDTLQMRIDGGAVQTAIFDATPGYTESRVAVTDQFVIKTNINDKINFFETLGVELTAIIPSGAYTGAALAAEIQTQLNFVGTSIYIVDYNVTLANRFVINSNGFGGSGIFSLLWATGTNVSESISYTLGFNAIDKTGSLTYFSDNISVFTVITTVNDTFTIRINGVDSASPITISQGRYTSVFSLITEISTQIANDPSFDSLDFTITYPSNRFRITSTLLGINSEVQVFEGANDFLQTIALDGDVPIIGGGDVGDINAVTVDEVVSVLNGEISGISAINDSNRVRISTISAKGSVSSIEITGGTCRTILGFALATTFGEDQNNKLKVNIDSDTSKSPIEVVTGTGISGASMAASIQTKLRAIGSGGYTNADCTFNETTPFQIFTNALRIVSGTFGLTSTVFVSDETISIVSTNNKIDFDEGTGEITCSIPIGNYNPTTLALEIKTQMETEGTNIYTVSYIGNQISIGTSGVFFSLLWATGTNAVESIANTIGFYNIDQIGSLAYSGIGSVKWGSCNTELGFHVQVIEPGHALDNATLTITDTQAIAKVYWSDHGGGNRVDFDIDLTIHPANTIEGLMNEILMYPDYVVEYDGAYLLGRISGPFKIEDEDKLEVIVNEGPTQIVEFEAKHPFIVSDANPWTRVFTGTDSLVLNIDGDIFTIYLETQLTPNSIAAKIQQEVRAHYNSNINTQSSLAGFICTYDLGLYVLISGSGGTGTTLSVLGGTAAAGLGLDSKTDIGSGHVVNSNFATVNEIVSRLTDVTEGLTDVTVSGPDYVKIISDLHGPMSRIQIGGTLASKLGFDLNINDDSNLLTTLSTVSSSSLLNITEQEIMTLPYSVLRGWDTTKGDVNILFYTRDNQNIIERAPIRNTRLSTISIRQPQIPIRIADIQTALTPTLYNARKQQVTIRLNKKTGSYVKVGDKLTQQENNNSLIATNNELIAVIDSILS